MNAKKYLGTIVLVGLLTTSAHGQKMFDFMFGPTWPKYLRDSEKSTGWYFGLEGQKVYDNIIGFGGGVDFGWNSNTKDSAYKVQDGTSSITQVRVSREELHLFFPISGIISIYPLPDSPIYPVCKLQLGFNQMVKSVVEYDSAGNTKPKDPKVDENGYYYGFISKISVDGVYDLGAHVAVFAGFAFQWGSKLTKKVENTSNAYFKKSIYGPTLRLGISLLQ